MGGISDRVVAVLTKDTGSPRIPNDHVIQRVARCCQICISGKNKIFDIVAQRPIDAALDRIYPLVFFLNDLIFNLLNVVSVVAVSAREDAHSCITRKDVVAAVSKQDI